MDFVFAPSRRFRPDRRDKYRVSRRSDGLEVVPSSPVPLHAAARWCRAHGISGRLRLFRPGCAVHSMSADIEWAAARTVVDGPIGPITRLLSGPPPDDEFSSFDLGLPLTPPDEASSADLG